MRTTNDKPLTRKQYLLHTIKCETDFIKERLDYYINNSEKPTDIQLQDLYIAINETIKAVNKL